MVIPLQVSETDSNPDNTIMQSSYDNLRNLIDRIRGTKHLAASQKHLSQDYKIANIQLQEQKVGIAILCTFGNLTMSVA